jgi:hypothetical protein
VIIRSSALSVYLQHRKLEHSQSYAIDGNFRLVHRAAAAGHVRELLHPNDFFLDQQEVDTLVSLHSRNDADTKDCHRFRAGDVVRSQNTTKKLDVTGVFAAVCEHDAVQKACDMKFGERSVYNAHYFNHSYKLHTSLKIQCYK